MTVEEVEDYTDHYNIKMTKSMRISAKSIKQLVKLGLNHHVMGKTFQ